ncbi:PEP-CTERM sorting domain-containing protein [Corallincola luteus]|uniref:PEP-CTERM sorting domain-containing protein n=2 Tax=Corallincola TaxID=1775176 RepID=A0A368N3Y1_9GAMM|nr:MULTISPECIES: PEP-CTERM sorting domain-containing protein [Corallincola]RCU45277.1 PEP-CTERM sorting domain-containing protein [Corallincola holothuriorum]TCI02926.1 PEP-CTERM sorting domain-containing protein [Corallincola luteus]
MKLAKIFGVLALSAAAHSAQADVIWDWSFGGEAGQFVTDGVAAGAGTFTLIDFTVTSSAAGGTLGSLVGGDYQDGQFSTLLDYSFDYDGAAVTTWNHSGANTFDWWTFDSLSSNISYFFGWDSGNINDAGKAAWWTSNIVGNHGVSDVTVTAAQSAVPAPAALTLMGLAVAGFAAARRYNK